MDNNDLMNKVRSYCFAAHDLLLYLDTHPDDKKAFAMFRDTVAKAKQLKYEYEKNCGPLSAFSAAEFDAFKWLDSPWPWEKEAN